MTDIPTADYTFGTMINPRAIHLCAPPVCIIPSTGAYWSEIRLAQNAGDMQNEIVRKLNCQLEHGFEREADVVYVMAEARKLFEHVRSNAQWRQFSTLLVDVLVDCPLVSEANSPNVKALSLSSVIS